MKTNAFSWRAVCLLMVALTTYVVCSCGGDEDPITPDPKPQENSEVSFTITNSGGTTGTPSAPVEVQKGDTLNMVISQKSSYKDVDGSVFSCEPKAKIELFAQLDTVYAKDVKALTDVASRPEVKSSRSGSKPVSHLTTQTFSVGGSQQIVFNLTHEVFNYVNKAEQTIEMPYVKPNQASFGNAVSEEKETRALEPVITLKPLASTRASVTDTALYMVSVRFNLELESVNAKTTAKQPVEFVVNYVGVVETTTELPEPVSELSYETSTTGGTSVSPFVVNPKEKFSLTYKQTSKYTDSYGNVFECSPKAQLSLHAVNDTVRAKSLDELVSGTFTQAEKEDAAGENPLIRTFNQTFIFGERQQIIFDTSTEVYQTKDGIEMPYMKFNPATFVSQENADAKTKGADVCVFATAVKLPQTRVTETRHEYYEIRVKFKMGAESVNMAEKQTVPMEFEVSYVGVVTTVTELPDPVSEYSYTASASGGTSSSPFVVNPKEKFELTYDGISRHTDSYGNVVEHNVQARLSLHAVNDTVRAKSLDELVSGAFTHTEKEDATGKAPTVYALSQSFKLGESQEIVFDTKTEAYRMKNGDEMPYLKFNPATFVSRENADAKTKGSDVRVFATAVKIPQTPQTRATETHHEYYEIHVKFKMDAETVHATKRQAVPMEFDISYVGMVETTTELPDPVSEISYKITTAGGTSSSPFVVNPRETFALTLAETSKYTDSYGKTVERTPKARLSLYAANDTVWAKSLDEILTCPYTENKSENAAGENPKTQAMTHTFNLGTAQSIVFDTSTEVYKTDDGIEMPYMKFNPAVLVPGEDGNASTTRLAGARAVATAVKLPAPQTRAAETRHEYYEIRVKFKMDAESVNATEKHTEPMEFSVSYVGVVTTEVEAPELVDVTYRTDYEWQDDCVASHLGYYAVVWRDRHYSNGEVISDRFVDYGHPMAAQGSIKSAVGDISAAYPDLTGSLYDNWLGLIEYRSGGVSATDSTLTLKAIAVIDSLQNVNITSQYGKRYAEPGDWGSYLPSKSYSSDVSINGSTENGWYFYNFNVVHGYAVDIYTSDISIDQYDQYLMIDGRRIDFLKYFEEPEESTSEADLPATDTTGPGKRYTHTLKMKRMGRNFIVTSIMDIYQRK